MSADAAPPGVAASPPAGEPLRIRANGRPAFSQVPKALTEDDRISPVAFRLWVILEGYTYRDADVEVSPSRRELAQKLNRALRTVSEALAELTAHGWLTVERRRDHRGGQATSTYVLEWMPRDDAPGAVSLPVSSVSAGQDWRQKTAPSETPIVDNSISAGQDRRQKTASCTPIRPQRAENCLPPRQKTAPTYRNNKNNQENNHHQATAEGAADAPLVVVAESPESSPAADRPDVIRPGPPEGPGPRTDAWRLEVQDLADAVIAALPPPLRRSVSVIAARRACAALAMAGWQPAMLTALVKGRSWAGAHNPGGALVAWLRDLAEEPPEPTASVSIWPEWCGLCDGPSPAQRTIIDPSDRVVRCPICNPKSRRFGGEAPD